MKVGVFFLRLSLDTLFCREKCGLVVGYLRFVAGNFVAFQFFCSLLCRIALNENEADRFCSTKIKIPAYCFKNFFRHRPTASSKHLKRQFCH